MVYGRKPKHGLSLLSLAKFGDRVDCSTEGLRKCKFLGTGPMGKRVSQLSAHRVDGYFLDGCVFQGQKNSSLLVHDAHWYLVQNFTTDIPRAKRWQALRQDSGDPFAFAPRVKEVYERMGIDYTDKFLVFSDALDLEKALALKNQCDRLGIKCEQAYMLLLP